MKPAGLHSRVAPVDGPVVFTHVPKTAGSSFHEMARDYVGDQRWFLVTNDDKVRELQALSRERLDNIAYCGGHIDFRRARTVWPRADFLCCVRDPWSRVVSHFLFLIREGGCQFDPPPSESLVDAFDHFLASFYDSGRSSNEVCRTICGVADHRQAIDVIERHYALVWTMPRIDDAWKVVDQRLGERVGGRVTQPVVTHRIYTAPLSRTDEDVALGHRPASPERSFPGRREKVVAGNLEDQRLFDWVTAHRGLWISSSKPGWGRGTGGRSLRVVVDGQEGTEGRALMVLSALHLHARSLRGVEVEIIDVSGPEVFIASEVLAYDEGLCVTAYAEVDSGERLGDADLYVAIAFGRLDHLRLVEAASWGVPCLVASQFPADADMVLPHGSIPAGPEMAHDPARFGELLCTTLDSIETRPAAGHTR